MNEAQQLFATEVAGSPSPEPQEPDTRTAEELFADLAAGGVESYDDRSPKDASGGEVPSAGDVERIGRERVHGIIDGMRETLAANRERYDPSHPLWGNKTDKTR